MTATHHEHNLVERVTAVLFVGALLWASVKIAEPFIAAIFGAIVICVSLWPIYIWLSKTLGKRRTLAAVLMTLITILIFVVPLGIAVEKLSESIPLLESWASDTSWLRPGDPPAWVEQIPLIGSRLTATWHQGLAHGILDGEKIRPVLVQSAKWLLSQGAGFARTMLEIILATVLSGFIYVHAEDGTHLLRKLARRVGNTKSAAIIDLAGHTIRGVSLGVIGTAAFQATLSGIGFALAGIPIYALLGVLCFITALMQTGTILIWVPAAIWLGYHDQEGWAAFTVLWHIFINLIDNFIKPYVISKGSNLPLLVIFTGVLGGLLAWGFMGMFIGSTLLAVAYTLFMDWLNQDRVA